MFKDIIHTRDKTKQMSGSFNKMKLNIVIYRGDTRGILKYGMDGGMHYATPTGFKILVVRAPGTTKKVAGQAKIMMQFSNRQP